MGLFFNSGPHRHSPGVGLQAVPNMGGADPTLVLLGSEIQWLPFWLTLESGTVPGVQVALPGSLKPCLTLPSSSKLPVYTSKVPEPALNQTLWVLENKVCAFYGILAPPQGRGGAKHCPDQRI